MTSNTLVQPSSLLTSCESAPLTSTHPSVVLTTAGVWSSAYRKFL